ncbi:MAG: DUF58 domain-containing protein [Pseudomonadota bacterium]
MIRESLYNGFSQVTRGDPHRKRRTTERGRMLMMAIVICAALGIDTDQSLVYQVFALLLSVMIVSRLSLRLPAPRLQLRRVLPTTATAGETFDYSVQITNLDAEDQLEISVVDNPHARIPDLKTFLTTPEPDEEKRNAWDRFVGFYRYLWLQRLMTGIIIAPSEAHRVYAGSTTHVTLTAEALRRGIVHFRSTEVRYPDPFGLNLKVLNEDNPDQLTILPQHYPMVLSQDPSAGRIYQPGGHHSSWSRGESHEFVALRDYQVGDSPRKIHWPSTARRGTFVVREYQDEYLTRHLLLLDLATEDNAKLEAAISAAASLLMASKDTEQAIDLLFMTDHSTLVSGGDHREATLHQLEALACVNASTSDTVQLLDAAIHHGRASSGFSLISCSWSIEIRQSWQSLSASMAPLRLLLIGSEPVDDLPAIASIIHPETIAEDLRVVS